MIRFSQNADFVSIELDEWGGPGSPGPDDAKLRVKVASKGFTGETSVWVTGDSLDAFRNALKQLEAKRAGRARLVSMSPRCLELTVASIDSRGHMAVEGSTGRHIFAFDSAERNIWHAVHFGFEFDPSQMEAAARDIDSLVYQGRQ